MSGFRYMCVCLFHDTASSHTSKIKKQLFKFREGCSLATPTVFFRSSISFFPKTERNLLKLPCRNYKSIKPLGSAISLCLWSLFILVWRNTFRICSFIIWVEWFRWGFVQITLHIEQPSWCRYLIRCSVLFIDSQNNLQTV